ncbi:hypothetical protein FHN55_00595 [Streptomyces sp. NP160]|nr:hypothetical protein FHN55_00595 [Streptomyces sp. NP160]
MRWRWPCGGPPAPGRCARRRCRRRGRRPGRRPRRARWDGAGRRGRGGWAAGSPAGVSALRCWRRRARAGRPGCRRPAW